MNEPEDTDSVAVLLREIRPVTPPADLMRRLLDARPIITAPAAKPKIVRFLPRVASAAAVFAITGTVIWFSLPGIEEQPRIVDVPPTASAPQTAALAYPLPLQSSQKLLGIRDLGISRDAQSRPVRLMHATWLDDRLYDQGNGAEPLRESRVRDEIVPVVLTTY